MSLSAGLGASVGFNLPHQSFEGFGAGVESCQKALPQSSFATVTTRRRELNRSPCRGRRPAPRRFSLKGGKTTRGAGGAGSRESAKAWGGCR
jgi:hypothetical protein